MTRSSSGPGPWVFIPKTGVRFSVALQLILRYGAAVAHLVLVQATQVRILVPHLHGDIRIMVVLHLVVVEGVGSSPMCHTNASVVESRHAGLRNQCSEECAGSNLSEVQ